jgi:hypothetical protein
MIEIRDGLSALALIVSGLSLFISWRTAQRTKAEKAVNAWVDLHRAHPEWWLATLNVKNNSYLGIEIEKLTIDLPDYRLGDLSKVNAKTDGYGNPTGEVTIGPNAGSYSAMPFAHTVAAGDTLTAKFLLYQPAHSRRKGTVVTVRYWTLEPKKQWRGVPVKVKTRSDM